MSKLLPMQILENNPLCRVPQKTIVRKTAALATVNGVLQNHEIYNVFPSLEKLKKKIDPSYM